jgi:hypothetical protein
VLRVRRLLRHRPGNAGDRENGKGDILATTFLEAGDGGRFLCTFRFSFDVTEGEDRYVVSVSRRGEMSYSFADLKANGVSLVTVFISITP